MKSTARIFQLCAALDLIQNKPKVATEKNKVLSTFHVQIVCLQYQSSRTTQEHVHQMSHGMGYHGYHSRQTGTTQA